MAKPLRYQCAHLTLCLLPHRNICFHCYLLICVCSFRCADSAVHSGRVRPARRAVQYRLHPAAPYCRHQHCQTVLQIVSESLFHTSVCLSVCFCLRCTVWRRIAVSASARRLGMRSVQSDTRAETHVCCLPRPALYSSTLCINTRCGRSHTSFWTGCTSARSRCDEFCLSYCRR